MINPVEDVVPPGFFLYGECMTRAERKEEKLRKEREFVDSIRGKHIDGKIKDLFRRTSIWNNFRRDLKNERKVDALTGRKLTKTWNNHHVRFDSKLYTDLDKEFFLCLNNQMHDFLHIAISETIKNPGFLDRLRELVEWHIKVNNGKDVRDFKD